MEPIPQLQDPTQHPDLHLVIADFIRGKRQRAGLTPQAFARAVGQREATVLRLEAGSRVPGSRRADVIAAALELDPDERSELTELLRAAARIRSRGLTLRSTRAGLDVAAFIRGKRQRAGLSQKAFAQMVGRHPRTVYSWESGFAVPEEALVAPIAAALELDPSERVELVGLLHAAALSPRVLRADDPRVIVRNHRLALGVTEAELAAVLDLPAAIPRHWEAGHGRPSEAMAPRVVRELGIPDGAARRLLRGAPRLGHVGEALRPRRIALGMPRAEHLGARIGVRRWAIEDIESGRRAPDADLIAQLAAVLGPDIAEWLEGAPATRPARGGAADSASARPPSAAASEAALEERRLGAILVALRTAWGVTTAGAAAAMRTSRQLVEAAEAGHLDPSPRWLGRLLDVAGAGERSRTQVLAAHRDLAAALHAAPQGPATASAQALRAACARRGLTRLGLASLIGAPPDRVCRWWRGVLRLDPAAQLQALTALPFTEEEAQALRPLDD